MKKPARSSRPSRSFLLQPRDAREQTFDALALKRDIDLFVVAIDFARYDNAIAKGRVMDLVAGFEL